MSSCSITIIIAIIILAAITSSSLALDIKQRRRQRNLQHWGFEHLSTSPIFPSTFDEVAAEVFHTITGSISGLQRVDPNIASNAMHKSILDYRPTHPTAFSRRRWVNGDDDGIINQVASKGSKKQFSRIGVEIDGAACLLGGQQNDEGRAMRMIALLIAKRLSNLPWGDDDDMESTTSSTKYKYVAVYFNTIEHCLLASRELSRWKIEEGGNSMDYINIHCLNQDSLPENMIKERQRNSNADDSSRKKEESIILVVKPTDIETDSLLQLFHGDDSNVKAHEPRTQANVVDKLQSLLFQASASDIPAVVISPRLSELPPMQQLSAQEYKRTGPSGFEQSGFQKSSTYGGIEPPVGPTPWLLRGKIVCSRT